MNNKKKKTPFLCHRSAERLTHTYLGFMGTLSHSLSAMFVIGQ